MTSSSSSSNSSSSDSSSEEVEEIIEETVTVQKKPRYSFSHFRLSNAYDAELNVTTAESEVKPPSSSSDSSSSESEVEEVIEEVVVVPAKEFIRTPAKKLEPAPKPALEEKKVKKTIIKATPRPYPAKLKVKKTKLRQMPPWDNNFAGAEDALEKEVVIGGRSCSR